MDIRFLIIGIALCVLGGVLYDAYRRHQKRQQGMGAHEFQQTVLSAEAPPFNAASKDYDPLLDEGDMGGAAVSKARPASKKENFEAFDTTAIDSAPSTHTNEEVAAPVPDSIIVLTLLPRNRTGFSGRMLNSAFLSKQLQYGEPGIFHKHIDDDVSRPVAFSVTSIREPGTFDQATFLKQNYAGLSLFMIVGQHQDPMGVFEEMLSIARALASALNGDVRDGARTHLTLQRIEHYREQIREFQRKQLTNQRVG